jgi:hypothetical protein
MTPFVIMKRKNNLVWGWGWGGGIFPVEFDLNLVGKDE